MRLFTSIIVEKEIMNYRWTPQLAYAVGLITTDGCLSSDGRHMTIVSSDIPLLKTFRNCLNLKNKITKHHGGSSTVKQCYRVQFGNVKFYQWLQNIGLFPNKTYSIGKLTIPKKFFADFMRGHLDGDGSIIVYTDSYNIYKGKRYTYQRLYTVFHSASSAHLEWIHSIFREILDVQGGLNSWTNKNRKIPLWKLKFAKKDSLKILSWMYYRPDVPCLERKRKIAQAFLKN